MCAFRVNLISFVCSIELSGPCAPGVIEMAFGEGKIMRVLRVKAMEKKGGGRAELEGPRGGGG